MWDIKHGALVQYLTKYLLFYIFFNATQEVQGNQKSNDSNALAEWERHSGKVCLIIIWTAFFQGLVWNVVRH